MLTDRSAVLTRSLRSVNTDRLVTWSALLARWTDFAQSALALPRTGEGNRWRAAVPNVVSLQAVTHALAELASIDHAEIPLALDRAELTIRQSSAELDAIWHESPLPPEAADLIADARLALAEARTLGWSWTVQTNAVVADHPAELAAVLAGLGTRDLFLASPGIPVFRTSPVAHLVPADWNAPVEESCQLVGEFLGPRRDVSLVGLDIRRQIYRQFDFSRGGPVRDLVLPIEAGLPAGQPLLVPALLQGAMQPVSLPPRVPMQLNPLPVVHHDRLESPID